MTALLTLWLAATPSSWVTSSVVDSLDQREKVSALLAAIATERLAAGAPLEADVAAETCLRIDRHRCSCIRDAGLAQGAMPSADAATLKAVHQHSAVYLWDYAMCDETAPDAGAMSALAAKWSGTTRSVSTVTKATLEAKTPEALLADGNARFNSLVPLEAKRRFETCATKQPVTCECAKRAGDAWLKLDDRQRAFVWWSRYLDCAPAAKDRPEVMKEVVATEQELEQDPDWRERSEPAAYVQVSSTVSQRLLKQGRKAVAEKRLDDAVVTFTACRLVDYKQFDCMLELAQTLQTLDKTAEAQHLRQVLERGLPPKDPRRAALEKLP
ncbi:MAG: hypothetical protein QM723_34495 [Myxococcaceae bacterium]